MLNFYAVRPALYTNDFSFNLLTGVKAARRMLVKLTTGLEGILWAVPSCNFKQNIYFDGEKATTSKYFLTSFEDIFLLASLITMPQTIVIIT